MKSEDLIFNKVVRDGRTNDYWFRVVGATKEELTKKYMEQSMIEVSEVVYSPTDGQWGIKRLFPFNFDVITPDDEELKNMIVDEVLNLLGEPGDGGRCV